MRLLIAIALILVAGCTANVPPVTSTTTTAPDTPAPSPVQAANDAHVARLMQSIAGRESLPAEQVFANVQWLKGVPAERFLRIMNGGYSRALGVQCEHCHVTTDFASDEKRPKRAAREMAVMHRSSNQQLGAMTNLETESTARAVSCSICHRGEVRPRT